MIAAFNGLCFNEMAKAVVLCYEFKWTQQEYREQSLEFVEACRLFLENENRKAKQANKRK